MMRCLSTDQKDLYQQYSILAKKTAQVFKLEKSINENIWQILSKEGIWSLPIDKQYGGKALGWQACVVALDGFFSHCSNVNFLILSVSQISSLYLISQYGTSNIKKRYLPRLMHGEIGCLLLSDHQFFSQNDYIEKRENEIASINDRKIIIRAEQMDSGTIFYIDEKISDATKLVSAKEKTFFVTKNKASMLYDLINFERLIYAILLNKYSKI